MRSINAPQKRLQLFSITKTVEPTTLKIETLRPNYENINGTIPDASTGSTGLRQRAERIEKTTSRGTSGRDCQQTERTRGCIIEKRRLCRSTTALPQEQIINCIGAQNVSLWNAAEQQSVFCFVGLFLFNVNTGGGECKTAMVLFHYIHQFQIYRFLNL